MFTPKSVSLSLDLPLTIVVPLMVKPLVLVSFWVTVKSLTFKVLPSATVAVPPATERVSRVKVAPMASPFTSGFKAAVPSKPLSVPFKPTFNLPLVTETLWPVHEPFWTVKTDSSSVKVRLTSMWPESLPSTAS